MFSGETKNEHIAWDTAKQIFWQYKQKQEQKRTTFKKVLRDLSSLFY